MHDVDLAALGRALSLRLWSSAAARKMPPVTQTIALLTAAIALVCAVALFFAVDKLPASRGAWIVVGLIVCALPALATTVGTSYAVKASSSTEFCLECHEMEEYGRSLFIDDRAVLPAVHYQFRLVDRDQVCYSCHTDYAMWGDVKAKLNGLQHVWVHYLGEVPETLELYQPYPNYNCLHCHEDARSYVEVAAHQSQFEALSSGERSCLECHGQGHALERLEEGEFWLGP
jgi:cytochrome c-type protein NapC